MFDLANGKLAKGGISRACARAHHGGGVALGRKRGGWRVDGECEIAITMLPSQAEMRWAQFAFANGRMRTSVFA